MDAVEPLWDSEAAAAACAGRSAGRWQAHDVSIDSRSLPRGALFVAIRGDSGDGHAYVADALKKGAAAAMVDHVPEGVAQEAPLLMVRDTQAALEALAAAARARSAARIVAVTGSAGKTGTKEMLRAAFARQGMTHASQASYNNQWGVPLSLARMPRETQFGVFEIGMNHAGEITPLTKIVRPHAAIVTTIAPAHIGNFESLTAIAEAKAEIFSGLTPGGVAVINQDNPFFDLLARHSREAGAGRIVGFGASPAAEARLVKAVHHAECSCVLAEICGQPLTCKIGLAGNHWTMNALAVLAVVQALGADMALAALALAELKPLAGRGRRHRLHIADGVFTLIDESYNANPASMLAALNNLSGHVTEGRGRRIAVLGDMAELGEEAKNYHRDLAGAIADSRIHLTFTAGREMQILHDNLPRELRGTHSADSAGLVTPLWETLRPGDVVMVKGSNSSNMGKIVKELLALGDADLQINTMKWA